MNGKRLFQAALFLLIAALFVQPAAANIIDDLFGVIGGSVQSITGLATIFFQGGYPFGAPTQSCSDLGGNSCGDTYACDGSFLDANDSSVCCDGPCVSEDTCVDNDAGGFTGPITTTSSCEYNGTVYNDGCSPDGVYVYEYNCSTGGGAYGCRLVSYMCSAFGYEGCANGRCVTDLQACTSQGGTVCSLDLDCSGNWINASDEARCCDADCVAHIPTCYEAGGTVCGAGENCSGSLLDVSDSSMCCSGSCDSNQLQSCSALGGDICALDEDCSGSWLDAGDSSRCCEFNCLPQPPPCGNGAIDAGEECEFDSDCASGDYCSSDCVCASSTPTCSTQGGDVCGSGEYCNGSWLDVSDSSRCCSQACDDTNGLQSCSLQGGTICGANESCDGNVLGASDSADCCDGCCVSPDPCIDSDSGLGVTTEIATIGSCSRGGSVLDDYCSSNNYVQEARCGGSGGCVQVSYSCPAFGYDACSNGACITTGSGQACGELGAIICGNGLACDGNVLNASDSANCCDGSCVAPGPTCGDLGGIVCIDRYSCDGNVTTSSDASSCCMGSCVYVEPPKTCSQLGGIVCLNRSCSGSFLDASDTDFCCDGNCVAAASTCSVQGGIVCGAGLACDGNVLNASDSANCCDGPCVGSGPCVDSDFKGGFKKEISKRGRCSQGTAVLEDYCSSSTYLMEARCGTNGCGYISYSCRAFGFRACVNGKCVKGDGDDDHGDDGKKGRKKRITADSNETIETTVSSPTGKKDIVVSSIGGKVKIISGGIEVETMQDVEVDGNHVVVGNTKLKILPEQASEMAKIVTSSLNIKNVEIKEQSGKIVYSVSGVRSGNFLFVIPMDVEVNTTIDAETGAINTVESWWGGMVN